MPFANEHAFRVTDPKKYDSFARKELAPGITAILGIKQGKSEIQAYRFNREKFTFDQAKKWIADHKIKTIEQEEATGKMSDFEYCEKTQLADGESRPHPILKVGTIYSMKYGEINITREMIDKMIENFKNSVMRIKPFIDKDHERKESYGDIKDIYYNENENKLYLHPAWNKDGEDAIINKKYKYLSADIGVVTDSETGQKYYPVLRGVSLVNFPVYKNQPELALSELPVGDIEIEIEKQEEIGMEEILKLIESIKTAMESLDDAGKAEAIKAIIENFGISPDMADKNKMKLSDEMLKLTDEIKRISGMHTKLSEENRKLKDQMERKEFSEKWMGKKLTPANFDSFFKLHLSDAKLAEEVIAKMPDVNTGEVGNSGSGSNIQLSEQDKAIMKDCGYDPDKPEDVKFYIEKIR